MVTLLDYIADHQCCMISDLPLLLGSQELFWTIKNLSVQQFPLQDWNALATYLQKTPAAFESPELARAHVLSLCKDPSIL